MVNTERDHRVDDNHNKSSFNELLNLNLLRYVILIYRGTFCINIKLHALSYSF